MDLAKGFYNLQPLATHNFSPINQQEGNLKKSNLLSIQVIRQTERKSHLMASKIKQLRTILGYDLGDQKIQRRHSHKKKESMVDERALSLKRFVLSMRKKADKHYLTIDQTTIHPLVAGESRQVLSMSEYTEATLRYIHSFLPHQTLMENEIKKRKIASEALQKNSHSPSDNSNLCKTTLQKSTTQRQSQPDSLVPISTKISLSHLKSKASHFLDKSVSKPCQNPQNESRSKNSLDFPSLSSDTIVVKGDDYFASQLRKPQQVAFQTKGSDIGYRRKRHRLDLAPLSSEPKQNVDDRHDGVGKPELAKAMLAFPLIGIKLF